MNSIIDLLTEASSLTVVSHADGYIVAIGKETKFLTKEELEKLDRNVYILCDLLEGYNLRNWK